MQTIRSAALRRTRMFACIVLGSCLLFCSPDTFGEDYSPYTSEQLSETYRSLPIQDRKELDRLSSERRKNELTEKRRVLGILERSGHPPFKMDQLLRDAYEYYLEWEGRDRETSIALFNKYIEKEPQSPFLPDIYAIIGYLYGQSANTRRGEKSDREQGNHYLKMAHEIWGERYSSSSLAAWANLACAEGSSQEERRKYYNWLLMLGKSGSAKNCYPYAELGMCYAGKSLELTEDDVRVRVKWLDENIDRIIQGAESYFLNSSTPEDLEVWAAQYPHTTLGQRAAELTRNVSNDQTEKVE